MENRDTETIKTTTIAQAAINTFLARPTELIQELEMLLHLTGPQ